VQYTTMDLARCSLIYVEESNSMWKNPITCGIQ
jgi:hypothetical protein